MCLKWFCHISLYTKICWSFRWPFTSAQSCACTAPFASCLMITFSRLRMAKVLMYQCQRLLPCLLHLPKERVLTEPAGWAPHGWNSTLDTSGVAHGHGTITIQLFAMVNGESTSDLGYTDTPFLETNPSVRADAEIETIQPSNGLCPTSVSSRKNGEPKLWHEGTGVPYTSRPHGRGCQHATESVLQLLREGFRIIWAKIQYIVLVIILTPKSSTIWPTQTAY